jgi:hypothetical protein
MGWCILLELKRALQKILLKNDRNRTQGINSILDFNPLLTIPAGLQPEKN